jgi:hypothetical protein
MEQMARGFLAARKFLPIGLTTATDDKPRESFGVYLWKILKNLALAPC